MIPAISLRQAAIGLGGIFVLALLVTVMFQRATIADLKTTVTLRTEQRDTANNNHRQTKINYRTAQQQAKKKQDDRIARVVQQQEEKTNASISRYRARVADLDRQLDSLRDEIRTRVAADSSAGSVRVRDIPAATSRADAAAGITYAPCDRECLASLIRFDELITWVETQRALSVGPPPEE